VASTAREFIFSATAAPVNGAGGDNDDDDGVAAGLPASDTSRNVRPKAAGDLLSI